MAKITSLTKKWGNKSIFDGFSLEVHDGKITAILGKSGVGKTTLLNAVAGLIDYEGSVEGFGGISYVFQEPRLIPFMTVKENLAFVLDGKFKDKNAVNEVIDGVLSLTKLDGLAERTAENLSGGEKQRASLARAFVYPSDTILMDEPFNSLDLGLKMEIMSDFYALFKRFPKTCLFVTHSLDEALFIADEVVVLTGGGAKKFSVKDERREYGIEGDGTLRRELLSLLMKE